MRPVAFEVLSRPPWSCTATNVGSVKKSGEFRRRTVQFWAPCPRHLQSWVPRLEYPFTHTNPQSPLLFGTRGMTVESICRIPARDKCYLTFIPTWCPYEAPLFNGRF